MRNLLIRFGLFIARKAGWSESPCSLEHLPSPDLLNHVKMVVADVETRFSQTSGDYKRREALRVLLNQFNKPTRDLNLLIELALR
jgi:hypothetical protein